jgi:signal transduction histidine kinase
MPSRNSKLVFGLAGVLMLAVLIGLAVVIANSQANDRTDIKERFSKRPQVSAALTSSLFSATTTTPEQQERLTKLYGGKDVSDSTLTDEAKRSNDIFIALLDEQGEIMALSAGAPPGVEAELASDPAYVQAVRDGQQPVALSDYVDLGKGGDTSQLFVQPIQSSSGTRLLVTGFGPENLYAFLSASITSLVDITGGQGYIIDSNGAVVASSDPAAKAATPVPVAGLTDALKSNTVGPVDGGLYYAAAPIENSSWQVVSVAPEDDVFATVNGAHKWTPWLIFAGFALALLAAFALLWRVLRNATELAEAHSQLDANNRVLKRRAKELERSNAELDQFASIASHDLQEPLRKVQMFSQRALEVDGDRLSEEGRDYLRRNTEAAARMQLLIEDLLTFSRVGTQNRPFVETDLNKTAQAVVSDLETAIQAAGGTVEIGDLPNVVVDEPQIRQLLQNLISNAIKFHRPDVPPVVRVDSTTKGRFAEVSVSDNGIGFDPRYANRIFRVFERLHGRGEYPGTGIGLALCRKIAERHGGSVTVDSNPGEGSVFTVTLPLQRTGEPTFEAEDSVDDQEREVVGV